MDFLMYIYVCIFLHALSCREDDQGRGNLLWWASRAHALLLSGYNPYRRIYVFGLFYFFGFWLKKMFLFSYLKKIIEIFLFTKKYIVVNKSLVKKA